MLISSCVVLDLYDDLMSSDLKEDLLVQSWIKSGDKLPSNCTIHYKVMCLCVVEGYCV